MCAVWIAPPPCVSSNGIHRYASTGDGKVTPLPGDMAGSFRLWLGNFRVLFTLEENVMRIFGSALLYESARRPQPDGRQQSPVPAD